MSVPQEVHNYEKVATSILRVGPKVLQWVFSAGCKDYDASETLKDYLTNKGWTRSRMKSSFDLVTLRKLDTSLLTAYWDVGALFQLVQNLCDGIADRNSPVWRDPNELECIAKTIRAIRNDTVHGDVNLSIQKTEDILDNILNSYVKLIEKASQRYRISPLMSLQFSNDIKNQLMEIRNMNRTPNELVTALEDHFNELLSVGIRELQSLYKVWSKVVPVFFLDGWDFEVQVDSIFTEMVITPSGRREEKGKIDCRDVLVLEKQNFILIEGQAGSGKSTLLKYFLSNWSNSNCSVHGLENYDVVLFFECRNRSLNSLNDLIHFLLSKSISKYSMIDYVKCLLNMNILFLLDGFDELNENSENLVREIFEMAQKPNIHVLVTSRPSDLKKIFKIKPPMAKVKHLRLDGIPHNLHEVFVERLHVQLRSMNEDVHDTAMLVQYIRKAPENVRKHFLFPLNLTLITVLWIISPEYVHRVTTITTLYKEILDLVNEKLCERLKKNPACDPYSAEDLIEASEIAFLELCERALMDLLKRRFIFDGQSIDEIRKFCSSITIGCGTTLALPYAEVIAAYMTVKHTWTSKSSLTHYSYPHRSFQENMAALAICQRIKNEGKDSGEVFAQLNISLNDHSNMEDLLTQLIGVMRIESLEFMHLHGPRLVSIIGSSTNSWKSSADWWLTFVSESFNDDVIAKESSQHIPTSKWSIEDQNVSSAVAFLKYIFPSYFDLVILAHLDYISSFQELVKYLSTSESEVSFNLFYNYWHPDDSDGVGDILMPILEGRCKLIQLTSHVNKRAISKLPKTLHRLQIAVNDDEAVVALSHLHSLPKLSILDFHLRGGVPLNILRPLPPITKISLTFSGITDDYIAWMVNAILKIQPSNSIKDVIVMGHVTALSTSSHHTAGGDGISKAGYKYLLDCLNKSAWGKFSQMPTRREFIHSSLFPEGPPEAPPCPPASMQSLKSPAMQSPFGGGVSNNPTFGMQSSSSNPFLPEEAPSIASIKGDIYIYSPILSDEDREDMKANPTACFFKCKLMAQSPF